MTPKTLFSIIIKVFGLFFLKDIFDIITQLLPTALYLLKPDMASQAVVTIAIYLSYILAYGFMAFYLIARSGLVIEKLKLDKGYDQELFQFNMHRSAVLAIAVMVTGGVLIVEGMPTFLGQLYAFYQQTRDSYRQSNPTLSYMVISGAKVLIGFLMITEKRWIINFIERQRQK